jgi:hypothetical protein
MSWGLMDEFGTSRVSSLQGMPHSLSLFPSKHHVTARTAFPEQHLDSQPPMNEERWAPLYQTYPLEVPATSSNVDRRNSTTWYTYMHLLPCYSTDIGNSAFEYTPWPSSDSYIHQSGTYVDSLGMGYEIGRYSGSSPHYSHYFHTHELCSDMRIQDQM